MTNTVKIAQEISMIMPRISRKIVADLFRIIDIPHAQLFVLMMLFNEGSCRTCDIGRELKVSAPTVTGIVSRLEKSGYIRRVSAKDDRRTVMVELTARGSAVANKLRAAVVKRWAEILEKIPPRDAEKYLEILRKIRGAL
jgi:DNA-binding MarR family transcriptional regulator